MFCDSVNRLSVAINFVVKEGIFKAYYSKRKQTDLTEYWKTPMINLKGVCGSRLVRTWD